MSESRDAWGWRKDNDNFRAMFESAPDAMLLAADDGTILLANEQTERLFGYERHELLGRSVEILVPARYRNRGAGLGLWGLRKDGLEFFVGLSLFPMESDNRLVVAATIRDVTLQKKADEERARLAVIADASMDAIIGTSLEGIITSWNKGAERMYGYTAKEIIGRHVFELIPPHLKVKEQGILDRLAHGEHVDSYETQRCRKLGEIFDVSLTISPVLDADGKVIGISKIDRDITAQKQASQYARSLLEASLDPLVTISADGKITDVNEGSIKVTGVSREKLIGTDFSDYFTEPDKAREGYREAFSKGFITNYPLTIRHREGTETPVLYNASVYKDGRGNVQGVFAAARDVTAQKKAEAEVAIQLKEIHHRVKNNLQVISSLLNLQAGYLTDPVARDIFKESQNRVFSIALVHEQIYQSAKLSHVNFGEYTAGLLNNLFEMYNAHERGITCCVDVDVVQMPIDVAIPCGLIVNELVTNVLKHAFPAGRHGTLQLALKKHDQGQLELRVADDGIGLPKGFTPRKARSLGLDLIFAFAEQLEATVDISNETGTCFRITFTERN